MKTKTIRAIIGLGFVLCMYLVNQISFAQGMPETGYIVATGQANVGTDYSNAAVILRGWQLQKNNSNDMEIMDLGLAITDVNYQASSGMVTWNVRMVNFSDATPTDDIRFSYDYSVILLTEGIAIDYPLPAGVVDKKGLTIAPEQISLNVFGYQSGAIFPTGFMLHVNPSPPTQGGYSDKDEEIHNFRFELADFNYNSSTGLARWNVITDFRDQNGSPEGYKWKYGYTIILTNSGQKFSRASGLQTSTGSGSIGNTFDAASIPQAVVAPIGWELGYASGDQNTHTIGASINNVSISGAAVKWTYNATLRDQAPDPFRWNVVAGGLIFSGTRIDGHYDSQAHYRFAVMPDDDGLTYEVRSGQGTYVPFTANLSNHVVTAGPLSSDRRFRHQDETGCGSDKSCVDPPVATTPSTLNVTSARIIDNGEGNFGGTYAKWHLWAFPAKGFDLEKFQIIVDIFDQYNHIFFTMVGHATSACAVSTLLHGPFLSDTNKPEWGDEGRIGEQYLEYYDEQGKLGFPIWDWEWPCDDRVVVFLWESDESLAPDDPLALFLIERGSTANESFLTADIPGIPGVLTPYGDQHLKAIVFQNARSPGDIFVDSRNTRRSAGWWWLPFKTVTEAVNAAAPNNIISVESGSYNEKITVGKPIIIRAHGGKVTIGQ